MSNTIAELNDSLIGRYLVEKEIGQGGMATVYLARDVRHDRKVAIKVLHPELAAVLGPERFVTEMKVTANLQHPHILPLFDSGTARNQLFYVMPFVEGESLRDRLQREQQLPIDDAVRITTEVAGALDYAHRHGVVHRDIKPENILLHDGTALVADFGIALAVSNAGGARLTQTGLSLGTPQYMSPEQATGDRNIDGRTDVYSLGCVLYEMLTGEPPFSGPSAQAIVAKVLTESVPAIRPRRATVSPSLEAAVLKAAQRAPADRFGTPAMFAEALRQPDRAPTSPVNAISPPATRLPWIIAASAGLLLAVGAYLLGRHGAVAGASRSDTWIAERLGGPPVAMLPRVSPDGRTVAFAAMINGTTQLAVLNPASGDWRVLTHDSTSGFVDQLSWSADGSKIYYSRMLNGPHGVFSITPLGADDRLVLGQANSPDALRDGSIVVQQLNADRRVQLYRFWPQSGRFDTLPASADYNVGANAFRVFPDGKEIAFIGVPGAHADTNAGLWALDLGTHRTRLLSRRLTQATTGSSFGVSPSGEAVLIGMAASGDAFSVLAIPRDGSDRAATLFTSTQKIYGVDAAADGTIYIDQFLRPARLLRYQPSTRRLTNDLMPPSALDDVLMLGDGRFVTTVHSAGVDRVMAISAGSPAVPLLPIDGATSGPVARLGDDRIVLRTGTDQDTLLVAVAATGRIVSRFPGFRGAGSVVGSPDGLAIYYIMAGAVWSIPAAGGTPRRLRDGDALAIDPHGKYLVIETDAADRVHLFRRPLDGSSETEIPITGRIPLSPKSLGPNTVAADGRILVTVVDPSRWHWPAAILDPRTGVINVIPTGPDYDVLAAWAPDGTIGAIGDGLESMLWRFRPMGGARRP